MTTEKKNAASDQAASKNGFSETTAASRVEAVEAAGQSPTVEEVVRAELERLQTNLPDDLKELDRWLLFKAVEKKGVITKLPCTVKVEEDCESITFIGKPSVCSAVEPKNFLTFEEATAAREQFADQVDGLGIALGDIGDFTLVGIDIDHCVNADGTLADEAQKLVDRFVGAYVEYSVSGGGVHILYFDRFAEVGRRTRFGSVEIYTDKRYFTVSGNLIHYSDRIKFFDGASNKLIYELGANYAEAITVVDAQKFFDARAAEPAIETDALLERIRASKAVTLQRLLDGDLSSVDGDHSRADFQAALRLCFWTNGNSLQIRDIIDRSALARDKWLLRADYPVRTIAAALKVWLDSGAEHIGKKKSALEKKSTPEPTTTIRADASEVGWQQSIVRTKFGNPIPCANNYRLILENDPKFKGMIGFDAFNNRLTALRPLAWRNEFRCNRAWDDHDDNAVINIIDTYYDLRNGDTICRRVIDQLAQENAFHPVRDFFDALPAWDHTHRAETLFIDLLGVEDTEYARAVTKHWLLAAIARIFNPGCKFDYLLVLKGKQGVGKSTILSRLGGKWFGELDSIGNSKDAVELLQGKWIMELTEMQATKKAENEQIKAFVSRSTDVVRFAYDRRKSELPRQCVLAGTTNDAEALKDQTGGRRFWILECNADHFNPLISSVDIAQIWSEVWHWYKQLAADGFDAQMLDIPAEVKRIAAEVQERNTEGGDIRGQIEDFLALPIPKSEVWQFLTREERRSYFFKALSITIEPCRIDDDEIRARWTGYTKPVEDDFGKTIGYIIPFNYYECPKSSRKLFFERRKFITAAEIAAELYGIYDLNRNRSTLRQITLVLDKLERWQLIGRASRMDPAYKQQRKVYQFTPADEAPEADPADDRDSTSDSTNDVKPENISEKKPTTQSPTPASTSPAETPAESIVVTMVGADGKPVNIPWND